MIPKIALFSFCQRLYALPVEVVLHILSSPRVFPLPLLPSGVEGVFLFKGEAIPLADPFLEGGRPAGEQGEGFVVVCGTENGLLGLKAEQVLQIVDREQGSLEKIDVLEDIRWADLRFVHRDREYPVLNLENLVASLPDNIIKDPETRSVPAGSRRLG